jgi:hypothetical protein
VFASCSMYIHDVYVYSTLQLHPASYITYIKLATSFRSGNEPSSGH